MIYDNGRGGGSGINCDGVQNSTIRNNLIYNTHASGISLYRIDGGGGSTGNLVVNNTVLVAADGRWALNIQSGSTGNTVRNNILYNDHSFRGSIDISADSLAGFSSDYNVVMDRFTTNGGEHTRHAGPVASGDRPGPALDRRHADQLVREYGSRRLSPQGRQSGDRRRHATVGADRDLTAPPGPAAAASISALTSGCRGRRRA